MNFDLSNNRLIFRDASTDLWRVWLQFVKLERTQQTDSRVFLSTYGGFSNVFFSRTRISTSLDFRIVPIQRISLIKCWNLMASIMTGAVHEKCETKSIGRRIRFFSKSLTFKFWCGKNVHFESHRISFTVHLNFMRREGIKSVSGCPSARSLFPLFLKQKVGAVEQRTMPLSHRYSTCKR